MNACTTLSRLIGMVLMIGLTACGGGSDWVKSDVLTTMPSYYIGGTVSGLASGSQVVLNNIGGDPVTVSADGTFKFTTPVVYSGGYVVTVDTQPTGQTCTVSNGMGAGAVADVSNIRVACSATTFSVAGAVFGLTPGQQVTVSNNGADAMTVSADGNFAFATPVALNGGYTVTVQSQPAGQTCTVTKGAGAGVTGNISNVGVVCSDKTFVVSGTIDGLDTGSIVTLNNNSADALILVANGPFSFATPIAYKGAYTVTVGTQPVGKICSVSGASGADVTANATGVSITCSTATYTISGVVSGLLAGAQVTLNNNGADPVVVTADGKFSFETPVAYKGSYSVTVGTNPTKERCHLAAASGNALTSDIVDVKIMCSLRSLYAYVPNSGSNTISQYSIGEDGALSPLSAPSIAAPSQPASIAVDRTGHFAYVVGSYASVISTYLIGDDGSLTKSSFPDVPTARVPYTITLDAAGRNAYVGSVRGNAISQYAVGANGQLSRMADVPTGPYAYTVAIDPAASFAYSLSYTDGTISSFAVGADGGLTPIGANVNVNRPFSIGVEPSGRFAYATDLDANAIVTLAIGSDGALSRMGSTKAGDEPNDFQIDPTGRYLYVAAYDSDEVIGFAIQPDGGLDQLQSVGTSSPGNVGVDDTGHFAYVTGYTQGISQFKIEENGQLTALTVAAATGDYPFKLVTTRGH